MAGFVAGTATTLLSAAVSVAAATDSVITDITIDNAAFGRVQVDITTDAASTAGADVYFVAKVNAVESTNKYQVLSVDAAGAAEKLTFELPAGVWTLHVKNNDATYAATVNQVTLVTYTWA